MATKIDIPLWQGRVRNCLDLQAKQKKGWNEIIKLRKGEFFGDPFRKESDLSELNFLHLYEKVKVSTIYAQNPFIFTKARSNRWVSFAMTMQTVINYYWRELQLKQKVKRCVRYSILIPPAFIGIGYTGTLVRGKPQQDVFEELVPLKIKTEGQLGIMDETIKGDDVFAKFISPWNMCWPDGYHIIREAPYIIEIQDMPLVNLFRNPLFKNAKFDIQGQRTTSQNRQPVNLNFHANVPVTNEVSVDDEAVRVKLFHIWDKWSNKRFTIAEGFNGDTMFERDWNYLIEGFPYYPLVFNEIPETDTEANSYPLSDVTPMIPQLRDLSIVNAAIIRHVKRGGTLLLVKKGGLTDSEIHNLQNSSDVDVVVLESIDESNLKNYSYPSMPSDLYRVRDLILEDLKTISGFRQLIAQAKGIETATESENVRAGERLTQSESIDTMEDFTVDIARGLAGLIWQFKQDKREIAEIIGEEVSEEMWPTLPDDPDEARKIIQKELQFRIDAGSTRPPKDEAVERKQWMDEVSIIKANFPHRVKDDAILKQWLKRSKWKDIEDIVITNDEQVITIAQKENELLLQGHPIPVTPNQNHQLMLQIHGQVYQTPGMETTPEFDQHVSEHATFYEQAQPLVNPQKGDSKIAPQTTTPDIRRRGVPEGVDLQGAAVKQIGVNAGR